MNYISFNKYDPPIFLRGIEVDRRHHSLKSILHQFPKIFSYNVHDPKSALFIAFFLCQC